jgi:hypothetical protein
LNTAMLSGRQNLEYARLRLLASQLQILEARICD